MIQLTLATVSCLAFSALLVQLFKSAYNTILSKNKFQKMLDKIPLVAEFNPFGGHIIAIFGRPYLCETLKDLHQEYGRTFGFMLGDQPGIATTDLSLIEKIVVEEGHINRFHELGLPFDEYEKDTLMFARDNQWRRMRKIVATALSTYKIKAPEVEANVKLVVENLIKSLDRRLEKAQVKSNEQSVTIDAEDIFHRYTVDLNYTCMLNFKDLVDYDSEIDYHTEIIDVGYKTFDTLFIKICVLFPSLKRPMQYFLRKFHPLGVYRRDLMSFIMKKTDKTIKRRQMMMENSNSKHLDQRDEKGLIDHLVEQFHSGKLTKNEHFNGTFFLFSAGDKTSADAISKLIYNLACHQETQKKLRESILKEGTESEYLTWCINESMRLFPPSVVGSTRLVSSDVKTKLGTIPENTVVVTSVYAIHRDPDYWGEDATMFKPERWLNANKFHPMQFIPFGAGKRICPGKDFALIEMKTLMNNLLRRFHFEQVLDDNDMKFTSPFMLFTIFEQPTWIKVSRID